MGRSGGFLGLVNFDDVIWILVILTHFCMPLYSGFLW